MSNMLWLLNLLSLCLLGLTAAVGPSEATLAYTGREAFELLHLYDPTTTPIPPAGASVAVSLPAGDLHDVSRSVLRAESWVRAHVLDHFPSAHITTVVVEASHLCNNDNNNNIVHEDPNLGPVLHSMKNIYHSLTRWGLQTEIKVSPSLSILCFDLIRETNPELAITVMSPLLGFLSNTNSTLSLVPPSNPNFDPTSDQGKRFLNSRIGSLEKHGIVLGTIRITLLAPIFGDTGTKHLTRKLSFVDFGFPDPVIPERPPTGSPLGFARAPSMTVPRPAFPPPRFSLPPCDPFVGAPAPAPAPEKERVGQWCVAKPSVPAETLQVAMDYACGRGGADCAAIKPRGSCYFPDTVVAHASYAFNSYWQRNKKNGGSCSFGGTAMVINSDPSFLHCRFVFS